jgi:hypothetical protein
MAYKNLKILGRRVAEYICAMAWPNRAVYSENPVHVRWGRNWGANYASRRLAYKKAVVAGDARLVKILGMRESGDDYFLVKYGFAVSGMGRAEIKEMAKRMQDFDVLMKVCNNITTFLNLFYYDCDKIERACAVKKINWLKIAGMSFYHIFTEKRTVGILLAHNHTDPVLRNNKDLYENYEFVKNVLKYVVPDEKTKKYFKSTYRMARLAVKYSLFPNSATIFIKSLTGPKFFKNMPGDLKISAAVALKILGSMDSIFAHNFQKILGAGYLDTVLDYVFEKIWKNVEYVEIFIKYAEIDIGMEINGILRKFPGLVLTVRQIRFYAPYINLNKYRSVMPDMPDFYKENVHRMDPLAWEGFNNKLDLWAYTL